MKLGGFILLCVAFSQIVRAQGNYAEFTSRVNRLYDKEHADKVWEELVSAGKIPLVSKDSVAFLYRGQANSVVWMGDFNGWGSSKKLNNQGRRIPETDIWILRLSLPEDARLDYKILINDQDFILDPANPSTQWSGVGGGSVNSELRMPALKEDVHMVPLPDAAKGKLLKDLLIHSTALGYQITYSVYTPHGYEKGKQYPILYVTDGYEYLHERMGNMTVALDNLIHLKKIKPVVAIFIDHREPVNRSVNRRIQELGMNEKYLHFISRELIPEVENRWTHVKASDRAIIGTSLGGLSAAWFAFSRPDLFDMAGMQSPAFWFKPEIYSLCERTETPPSKVFMTTGLIHDTEEGARKMRDIFQKKGFAFGFREVNQGHSWGNWRGLIDDMLMYLVPE